MSENGLVDQQIDDVVVEIVDREDDRDPEAVREALNPITVDGVITAAAIETAVSDTSKVVATAETRTELAGMAYEDAMDAAAPVADLDIVAARLDEYVDRLEAVEARAAALTDDLRKPVEQLADPDAVYELAVQLREVATTAQGVAQTADDLSFDLEAFESWLDSPYRRYNDFAEDVDLVDESVAEVSAVTAALPEESDVPAASWADATMQTRVLELLVADLRAELTDLRVWADREDVPFRTALDERVTAVEQRINDLDDTLGARAESAWREQFANELTALNRDLDGFDSPVDWGRVQETLTERREEAIENR